MSKQTIFPKCDPTNILRWLLSIVILIISPWIISLKTLTKIPLFADHILTEEPLPIKNSKCLELYKNADI